MPMRPVTWLKYAPVALLPLLAAYAINSGRTIRDLEARAAAALAEADAGWASVRLDGRDAWVAGDAPTQEAIDAAVKTVGDVYGIRRVETGARVVPQPAAAGQGG
jgi:hypothetical protein